MKKKLLILTTGGTIACTAGACGYVPTLTAEKILAFVPDPPDAVLSVRAILSKDSSNITPCDWQLIARTIKDLHKEFDGIVVLHGTDTMAYSAAAVEFMTLGVPIPVIFTGAQRPIGLPDSDGAGNLCDALHAACCELLRGVFVVFDGVILNHHDLFLHDGADGNRLLHGGGKAYPHRRSAALYPDGLLQQE